MDSVDYFGFAASLAHPYLSMPNSIKSKIDDVDFDFDILHSTLKSNKVLMRTLDQVDNPSFPSVNRDILRSLIRNQVAFRRSHSVGCFLKAKLLEMAETFGDHNVEFVFVKSINTLPIDSDNFDVLVREEALPTAVKLLLNLGYVEVTWVKEPYKRLFRKVKDAEDQAAIHLHTRIAWDGLEFLGQDDVWDKYQEKKLRGVTLGFPSCEHHMLITSAHSFFENHCFKLSDLIYTIDDGNLKKQIDWNYLEQWVRDDDWAVPFAGLLRFQNYLHQSLYGKELFENVSLVEREKEDNAKIRDIAKGLVTRFNQKQSLPIPIPVPTVARFYIGKIMKDHKLSFTDKVYMTASLFGQYVDRRIRGEKHPSFIISFSGKDGTGKTTHARYLWNGLRERGIKSTYMWSRGIGLSFEPFMRIARKFLLGRAQATEDGKYQLKREGMLGIKPIRLLWGYLTIVDHLLQIMIRVNPLLLLNYVVICDRFIYDTFEDAEPYIDHKWGLIIAKKTIEKMIPSPTITFLMQNKPFKPLEDDFSTKHFGNRRTFLKRDLMTEKNVIMIDTTKTVNENATKILSSALGTYYSYSR